MRKRYSKKKQSLKRMKRKYTRKGKYSRRMKTGKAGMRRGATPSQDLARYGVEGWCRGEADDSAWGAPPHSANKCNLLKMEAQKKAQATGMPGAVMQPVDEGGLQHIRQKLDDRSQEVLQEGIRAARPHQKETEEEQDEQEHRSDACRSPLLPFCPEEPADKKYDDWKRRKLGKNQHCTGQSNECCPPTKLPLPF